MYISRFKKKMFRFLEPRNRSTYVFRDIKRRFWVMISVITQTTQYHHNQACILIQDICILIVSWPTWVWIFYVQHDLKQSIAAGPEWRPKSKFSSRFWVDFASISFFNSVLNILDIYLSDLHFKIERYRLYTCASGIE